MLDFKIELDAFDSYAGERAPVTGKTIFSPGIIRSYSPKAETGARDTLYSPRVQIAPKLGNGIGIPFAGEEYSQTTDIPEALALTLTDKTSRGIYEDKPIIKRDSVFGRLLSVESQPEVLNATVINHPAVESLETIQYGNPLTANYLDQTAMASGNDSLQFLAGNSFQEGIMETGTETEELETAPSEESDSILRVPGVFDLNKQTLKETGVFIIGAIILAIGILALTRGN